MNNNCKYACTKCDYHTSIKQNYEKHIFSEKHKKETKQPTNICSNCKCMFNSHTTLWRHSKKCNLEKSMQLYNSELEQKINIQNEIIEKYKKDIENLQTTIDDNEKNIVCQEEKNKTKKKRDIKIQNNIERVDNINIENKIQNNTNINLYLNQECGSAINFVDFIKSIIIEMSDIKMIGHVGYVDAISNIIKTNLKNQDITKRPIHCEKNKIKKKLHIRDQNTWKKNNKEVKYIINDGIYELDSKIMEGINYARYAGSDLKNEVSQMRKHSSIHTSNGKEQKKITETILEVVPIPEQVVNI